MYWLGVLSSVAMPCARATFDSDRLLHTGGHIVHIGCKQGTHSEYMGGTQWVHSVSQGAQKGTQEADSVGMGPCINFYERTPLERNIQCCHQSSPKSISAESVTACAGSEL